MFFIKSRKETQRHSLESFFDKFAGWKACNYIKKRLQHVCFSVKFVKFLGTPLGHL